MLRGRVRSKSQHDRILQPVATTNCNHTGRARPLAFLSDLNVAAFYVAQKAKKPDPYFLNAGVALDVGEGSPERWQCLQLARLQAQAPQLIAAECGP
jgi:hypothetical protein